jgi:hypothetical protein
MLGQYDLNSNPSIWWGMISKLLLQLLTYLRRSTDGTITGISPHDNARIEVLLD